MVNEFRNSGHRGRGRGGNFRGRGGRQPPADPTAPVPDPEPVASTSTFTRPVTDQQSKRQANVPRPYKKVFAPRAISINYTEEKNDPCLAEAAFLVEDAKGYAVIPQLRRFQMDFSLYITLAEESYKQITSADKGFRKEVPESVYMYYCIVILWRRLFDVGKGTNDGYPDIAVCSNLHNWTSLRYHLSS